MNTFLNDPIANAYEPGSTMKVFTLAAAINEGVYNGKEYFQSGKYSVGSADIKDHNGGFGWGSITFDEGFERSSNVAFSILEDQLLKPNKFKQYMNKFGFNQKTGIDLPGESKNTLLLNTQIQQVTTSFGQGSTVTPIQLIQAATAIANDGKMMQPYIVDKVVNPTNKQVIMENQPKEVGNPIKKGTADKVRDLMERVITSSKGTGTMYKVDGYPIGGKTGTAQIPNPENGRYMEGKENYIFSFLGMAPIDDPELIVYLAIKQPKLKGDEYGAQPLAEIFKPVVKNSLEYLKVKPYTEQQMADATKKIPIKSAKLCESINRYGREQCEKRETPTDNFRRRKNKKNNIRSLVK
ncbi:peptidoglycan D,D-transpeptidase FtsI family protein [Bacillus pacificus]